MKGGGWHLSSCKWGHGGAWNGESYRSYSFRETAGYSIPSNKTSFCTCCTFRGAWFCSQQPHCGSQPSTMWLWSLGVRCPLLTFGMTTHVCGTHMCRQNTIHIKMHEHKAKPNQKSLVRWQVCTAGLRSRRTLSLRAVWARQWIQGQTELKSKFLPWPRMARM